MQQLQSDETGESCTTILVGKKASYDGSTMIVRSADNGVGKFNIKHFVIIKSEDQPKKYKAELSKVEIDLPDNPLQYSAFPFVTKGRGLWSSSGINSLNVGMSATETITSNALVLGADPLVENGIGEEDYVTIVLPYIKSAKEGVIRLGSLVEKYGTYEMNGIGFNDENDVWWIETIGGHHWIARRLPDDCYACIPNQQGIDEFDFTDAFGDQKNYMCSKDMIEFIVDNHLDLNFTAENLKNVKNYKIRITLGSHTDFDISYNTCRAWFVLKYLNKSEKYEPDDFNLPFCKVPEHKITIQDLKYIMSSYFNNTKYNPYLKYGDHSEKGRFRYIGINRTYQTAILQIRGYMPEKLKGLQWMAIFCNAFNAFVPQYSQVDDTCDYLKNVNEEVSTDNMYWTNRIIAALTDAHYNTCIVPVEQYQLKVLCKSHELVNKFDKDYMTAPFDLKEANKSICDYFKKETSELLGKVLFISNSEMKNAFSRSDS